MANAITVGEAYDPYFYANEGLIQLNKSLGLAFFVVRDYDRTPTERGSTIKLRRPAKFAAQAMPIATGSAEDILPDYENIVLDQWFGAMFKLTDKELTYTRQRIVDEHVGPLAIAVADKIDQTLAALSDDIGYYHVRNATVPVEDFPDIRKILFNNQVPDNMRRYMVGGTLQNLYEKEDVFYQANTGVDAEMLQRGGVLGGKFGFSPIFANQNATSHTAGTLADTAGALTADHAKGATTVTIDGLTDAETIKAGASFQITGDPNRYAITGDLTVASNSVTATIPEPGLRQASLENAVVTLRDVTASERGVAFHRNAFALAMAPLSSLGDGAGAKIASVADPITSVALRATIFYDGGAAANYVRIDGLWGKKTLDPHMAVNVEVP